MKQLLLGAVLACGMFCSSASALGGFDTLPKDRQGAVEFAVEKLGLTTAQAFKLYKDSFDWAIENVDDWSIHTFGNDTLTSAEKAISDSEAKVLYMTIVNNNRVVNMAFIRHPGASQVQLFGTETVTTSSSAALEKYETLKKDEKYELSSECNDYAVFKKSGYTDRVVIRVAEPNGTIQYVQNSVISLNEKK